MLNLTLFRSTLEITLYAKPVLSPVVYVIGKYNLINKLSHFKYVLYRVNSIMSNLPLEFPAVIGDLGPDILDGDIGTALGLSLFLIAIIAHLFEYDKPPVMIINLRVIKVIWGVIIFDLQDKSGRNLFTLYADTMNILWFPLYTDPVNEGEIYCCICYYLQDPLVIDLMNLNPLLFNPQLSTLAIVYSVPGYQLEYIWFDMFVVGPAYFTLLLMRNRYGLVLKSEGDIIPLIPGEPINLKINFFGALAGLSVRQMLIAHGINTNLFL